MKIDIKCGDYNSTLETFGDVSVTECYNGILVKTPNGDFGITQRDGGIEVAREGKLIFASVSHQEAHNG